jgi:hypothetical protein
MNENSKIASGFNKAATMTPHSAYINARVEHAIMRMNDHFKEREPALAQARYRDLLTKQGNTPELRPSYGHSNPPERMWKAAKQMVKFEHLHRLNRIRRVGEKMIGRKQGLER